MEITSIDKEKFFKPVDHPRKIKETFIDIYNKIDILNERLKKLEITK